MSDTKSRDSAVSSEAILEARFGEYGESIDRSSSLLLNNEKDQEGMIIPAEATWIKIVDEKGLSIEGKFYVPQGEKNNEIIIINPGLPGDGIAKFEEAYVAEMVSRGYTVFCSRHNGLRVTEDAADKYTHCPEKKQWAKDKKQEKIGGQFSFQEWGREVLTAIKGLEAKFEKLHFVGHSAGSLNILNSLGHLSRELPHLKEKIGSFVSMAGVVGEYDKKLMAKILSWVTEIGVLGSIDEDDNLRELAECEDFLRTIDWSQFPNMSSMFITPAEVFPSTLGDGSSVHKPDEYVDPASVKHFTDFMREQGCDRVRTINYGNMTKAIKPGHESHDFDHLSPGIVMRSITGENDSRLQNNIDT
jgi:hypothetical protein